MCFDDNTLSTPDSGCSKDYPVCNSEPDNKYGFDCLVCRVGDGIDEGCDRHNPICNANNQGVGNSGSECVQCRNNKDTGKDRGCDDDRYPECVAPKFGFGEDCALCVNDASNPEVDSGCDDDFKVCVAHFGEGGKFCAKCVNDEADPTIQDSGCTEAGTPICVAELGEHGDECAFCVNNRKGDAPDDGCMADLTKPLCNAAPDCGGDECFKCQDTEMPGDSTRPDLGCETDTNIPVCLAPVGGFGDQCVFCINDQTGDTIDSGCDSDEPLCNGMFPDGAGVTCFKCINDMEGDDKTDTGCEGDTPVCDVAFGEYGDSCVTPIPPETATTDPATTDPATTDPATTDPATTDPATTDPATTDPATTDPATTDPATTDPATTDPATTSGPFCINNNGDATADTGCDEAGKPLCNGDFPGGDGDQCFKCQNTEATDGNEDLGCSVSTPNCDASDGEFGNTCECSALTETCTRDANCCDILGAPGRCLNGICANAQCAGTSFGLSACSGSNGCGSGGSPGTTSGCDNTCAAACNCQKDDTVSENCSNANSVGGDSNANDRCMAAGFNNPSNTCCVCTTGCVDFCACYNVGAPCTGPGDCCSSNCVNNFCAAA